MTTTYRVEAFVSRNSGACGWHPFAWGDDLTDTLDTVLALQARGATVRVGCPADELADFRDAGVEAVAL